MARNRIRIALTFVILLIILIVALFFLAPMLGGNGNNSEEGGAVSTDPRGEKIAEIKEGLSDNDKAAQLFLAKVPTGNEIETIEAYKPGGYLIFGADVEGQTQETLTQKISSWQEAATTPMIIASDEEGGEVTRVSSILETPFLAPADVYAQGGVEAIREDTLNKSEILKGLGINVNLAPVADVAINPQSFIYSRTLRLPIETDLTQAAELTSQYVVAEVEAMKETQIGCSLKHFPGYGENPDSHTDVVRDEKDLATFETIDYIPFKAGIDAGAGSVLVSHNIAVAIDPNVPASLSPQVHQVLREQLGFGGVIITDDFDMEGLSQFTDQNSAAIQTINAGTDLIISSTYSTQIQAVVDALNSGQIPRERFEEAVDHVLGWKYDLGLLN